MLDRLTRGATVGTVVAVVATAFIGGTAAATAGSGSQDLTVNVLMVATFHSKSGEVTSKTTAGSCTMRPSTHEGSIQTVVEHGARYLTLALTGREKFVDGNVTYTDGSKPVAYTVDQSWNGHRPVPLHASVSERGKTHALHVKTVGADVDDPALPQKTCVRLPSVR